ncbi:MAG: NUDIX domain-containing protein [Candidatus Nanoarchaeia archaeon]
MAEKAFLATDIIVLKENNILLIKRKNEPYKSKYALPGGFVEKEERIEETTIRELWEETGIKVKEKDLGRIGVYSEPKRDPRGRVVSFVFKVEIEVKKVKAGDDAEDANWFSLQNLPELAFDHEKIIEDAKKLK